MPEMTGIGTKTRRSLRFSLRLRYQKSRLHYAETTIAFLSLLLSFARTLHCG